MRLQVEQESDAEGRAIAVNYWWAAAAACVPVPCAYSAAL